MRNRVLSSNRLPKFALNIAISFALTLHCCTIASAAGPEVNGLFPAGGQRGTTAAVTVSGKNDPWPVQTWASTPGLSIAPGEKGKLAVTIAADAIPGLHWIRLYDASGASAPQPFVVGTLAEINETEPNNKLSEATAAGAATIVNGKLGRREDVDLISVPLTAGQTLVASLAGHETLGSPMDSVLHLVSATGHQLAYNHDGRGLDPELVFTAPADGTYVLRIFGFPSQPNQTIGFSGSEQYLYRLTLTTAGFIDYPWPLAVTRDQQTQVNLVGWNIPEALATTSIQSSGETTLIADAQLANVASVRMEPHPTLLEAEPNAADAPQSIGIPATITGRIGDRSDTDTFSFEAKAGQAISFEVESRALGYPLDAVLTITDGAGKSLARVDDVTGRDASTVFAPPADGVYRITVSDLNRQGSERHVYRLRAVPATPNFEVTADANAYIAAPDKPAEIALAIDRRHGFAEEIAFTVQGLPESVSVAPVKSAAEGDTAKSVKLVLTSSGTPLSGPIRIEAKAAGSSQLVRTATAPTANHTARLADLWLTATAAKPAEPAKP
jgi:hypothetical protein